MTYSTVCVSMCVYLMPNTEIPTPGANNQHKKHTILPLISYLFHPKAILLDIENSEEKRK